MKYCAINGNKQTHLAVTDRGLAYGDGIFTTAKIIEGQVILLERHLMRLIDGCNRLKINTPEKGILAEQMRVAAKGFLLGCLKVVITSGSGGRGYSRSGLTQDSTQVIVMVNEFPTHYQKQCRTGITLANSEQQISSSPMLAGIKHLNRLEQVLLRAELDMSADDDLVVTNEKGHVIETTCANLFYWRNNQLYTPNLISSGVDGIIRQTILRFAPSVNVVETSIDDLHHAEEIFICNSLMGIMPVKTYNNRQLQIKNALKLQVQLCDVI